MIIPQGIDTEGILRLFQTGTPTQELILYLLLFCIILLECGFPPMVWLPGDSLLFLSGLYAATGILEIRVLLVIYTLAGIMGYIINYSTGRFIGLPILINRFPGIIPMEELDKASRFFERWGTLAVLLGRFMPVVRTLVPFFAGIARIEPFRFVILATISGLLWGPAICGTGYVFGSIPGMREYQNQIIFLVSAIVITATILPISAYLMKRKGRST